MKLLRLTIWALLILSACKKSETVFTAIPAKHSGIDFVNEIVEYDSFNILNTEFIYNGAGIGIGDLNEDGLEDLFFAGNQVGNVCYLNTGNFKFRDITQMANLHKPDSGMWSSGVTILDLNADGKKDIYITNTLIKNASKRKNLFYLNTGNNPEGIPQFKEMASEYGLDDTSYASHAQFFDYDRDGDLDLFIGTNFIDRPVMGQYVKDVNEGCNENCDKLYRNDWDSLKNHPYFRDVSAAAGMTLHGYSHSTLIHDFNEDGWPDIYIANDYQSDDLIYINNANGSFTNKVSAMFRHQSSAAMGSDLGDINNDGKAEVMTVEMLPFTNLRKKTLIGPANYSSYIYVKQYGYQYQYTRNTLQLNQGMKNGYPVYGDISFLSGVHETEWSWAPVFVDIDLDSYQDLYITNGFPKDVTDHDFGEYRNETRGYISDMDLQNLIPVVKVSNFMYSNRKDLSFTDVTKEWGMYIKSFSNGVVYGDLDNDGDMDMVVHNIDDAPFVFRNNTLSPEKVSNKNYLNILLKGSGTNPEAIGSSVDVFYDQGKIQTRFVLSGRGYLSQSSYLCSFGLDTIQEIDSIKVKWADGSLQKFGKYKANQKIVLTKNNTIIPDFAKILDSTLLEKVSSSSLGIDYLHHEKDFIDFNIQKTIPHKMSQYGVPVCAGDIDGNGTEDMIIGASANELEFIYLQDKNGSFSKKQFAFKASNETEAEDAGMLLLDVDSDDDLDMVISGGSYENLMANKAVYGVRLFINDGRGNFTRDSTAIDSKIWTCSSTIRSADIDSDGDLDLFIAGHVLPGYYPKHDRSYILINESTENKIKFSDATDRWISDELGLLNDAIFSDYNNDGKPDLLLATEWGPVTILRNTNSSFEKVLSEPLSKQLGWWTSLNAGDFDCDGDMDYIAGNYGENTYFKCNEKEPITIYAKDFDSNGSLDPFISCYWRDTAGQKKEYFFHGRDEMIKQLLLIRRKFQKYAPFGLATVKEVFPGRELDSALILKANTFSSVYIQNLGNDKFSTVPLPNQAQVAPIFGMQTLDANKDGYLDLVVNGNDYGMELIQGRADAMSGVVLLNNKKGWFSPVSINESGFFTNGENRTMSGIYVGDKYMILQMVNLDSLYLFKSRGPSERIIKTDKDETYGILEFADSKSRKLEFYPGDAYKSQRSNVVGLPPGSTLRIFNSITKKQRMVKAEN